MDALKELGKAFAEVEDPNGARMVLTDMTKAAVAGFAGEPCEFYFSSPLWLAHAAGKALKAAGHSEPKTCVLGSGYAVKVVTGYGAFKLKFSGPKLDAVLFTGV
jgi:hypothetical protein